MPKALRKSRNRRSDLHDSVHPCKVIKSKSDIVGLTKDENVIEVAKTYKAAGILNTQDEQEKDSIVIKKNSLKKRMRQKMKREKWIKRLVNNASKLPSKDNPSTKNNKVYPYMELTNLQDALEEISGSSSQDCHDSSDKTNNNPPGENLNIAMQLEKVKAVISHPEYSRNPLDAIRRHLSSTL